MKDEFIYPTKSAKIIGAISVLLAVLLYYTFSPLVDLLFSNFDDLTTIEDKKLFLIIFNIMSFILFFLIAAWWSIIGTRTIKNKYFPPKGYPVVIRTRIQTGKSAITSAIFCYLSSLLIMPFVALFAYMAWLSYGI